jgi:hypothetical protein
VQEGACGCQALFSSAGPIPSDIRCDYYTRKMLVARDFWGEVDRGPGRKRVGGPKKRKVCKDDWEWNMGKVPRGQQQPQHYLVSECSRCDLASPLVG